MKQLYAQVGKLKCKRWNELRCKCVRETKILVSSRLLILIVASNSGLRFVVVEALTLSESDLPSPGFVNQCLFVI